jgi:hypothetical protein
LVATREGDDHPDRDAQFEYINRRVSEQLAARQPVISGADGGGGNASRSRLWKREL